MADILLFPAERALAVTHQYDAPQTQAEALAASLDADAWPGDDTSDNGCLETVASLAAAPSQSLAGLVTKVEVLVARLAPDDGTDAGLCLAEAGLLQSVLCDLRAFVMMPSLLPSEPPRVCRSVGCTILLDWLTTSWRR